MTHAVDIQRLSSQQNLSLLNASLNQDGHIEPTNSDGGNLMNDKRHDLPANFSDNLLESARKRHCDARDHLRSLLDKHLKARH